MSQADTTERDQATQHDEHAHPSPREYVKVAVLLAVVTAVEIALFYIEDMPFAEGWEAIIVAALILLMVVKFAYVALWFMHLKFDNPLFMRLFIIGLGLAVGVFGIVLLTFGAAVPLALATMALGLLVLAVAAVRGA